ncbi:hypothetical protein P167DRAFT_145457 [Morchella conica CCBAS932]|uniref:Uncharacterized protein n=1 Tax=Morchella conica CCBAS932 TaxID=1392247 RepID=A0A3N4KQR6_9PEZI|nr:hypothetical protein P167DRAFT_145457 [Morchella conica CCBAS932]
MHQLRSREVAWLVPYSLPYFYLWLPCAMQSRSIGQQPFTSAPFSRRSLTIASFPSLATLCNAVMSHWSTAFISAPLSRSSLTIASRPISAALCSKVCFSS